MGSQTSREISPLPLESTLAWAPPLRPGPQAAKVEGRKATSRRIYSLEPGCTDHARHLRTGPGGGSGPLAAQPILLGRLWIRQSDQQRRKLTKAGVELGPHRLAGLRRSYAQESLAGHRGAAGLQLCRLLPPGRPQPLSAALKSPRTGWLGLSLPIFPKTKQLQLLEAQQKETCQQPSWQESGFKFAGLSWGSVELGLCLQRQREPLPQLKASGFRPN